MTDTKTGPIAIIAAAILAVGLVIGGWVLGNGLTRAKFADRSGIDVYAVIEACNS